MSRGLVVAMLAGARRSVPALLCVPTLVLAQASAREPLALTVGQSMSATQHVNEPLTYVFAARSGETYLIEVEQLGLDVVVTVEDAEGNATAFNSPLKRDESEYALLENAAGADYRIRIDSAESTDASGAHTIRVLSLGPSTANTAALEPWRRMSRGASSRQAAGAHTPWTRSPPTMLRRPCGNGSARLSDRRRHSTAPRCSSTGSTTTGRALRS